jgi:ubiquinol-cytochrome c reductase cytochrome c1 subunit
VEAAAPPAPAEPEAEVPALELSDLPETTAPALTETEALIEPPPSAEAAPEPETAPPALELVSPLTPIAREEPPLEVLPAEPPAEPEAEAPALEAPEEPVAEVPEESLAAPAAEEADEPPLLVLPDEPPGEPAVAAPPAEAPEEPAADAPDVAEATAPLVPDGDAEAGSDVSLSGDESLDFLGGSVGLGGLQVDEDDAPSGQAGEKLAEADVYLK